MGVRKRMLDPSIWGDEGFLELSDAAKILFIGLISNADDEGRGSAMPNSLKARIFPADLKTPEVILGLLAECYVHVRLIVYRQSGGVYYELLKWRDYQRVDHPQPSTIPGPDAENIQRRFSECYLNAQGALSILNALINKDTSDGLEIVVSKSSGREKLEDDLRRRE